MKLQTKILSAVIGIISIITITGAFLEVRYQMAENEKIEDESQFIQAANVISTFELALWNIDVNSAEAGLLGLFESASVKRAQVFDAKGELFTGLSLPSGDKSNT
ncbi:MAG: hypothetical protein HQK54_15620, partial [Oligoflexales bacterium]|nr:hypothetical protein [Oligoflexales bacterium]